jgi:tetratricopeptide (TPR) repeat protein
MFLPIRERVSPLREHARVDTSLGGVSKAGRALLDEIDRGYWKTISKLPHAHCQVQLPYASGASLMDPADCPFCGIFADLQYINLGYWLYSRGRPKEALDVLKAAQSLCPWSAQAVAFEGSAYAAIGQFDQAVAAYEKAVLMRPDYPPYKAALESLRTSASLMSHGIDGDGLSSLPDSSATPLDIVRARRSEHWRMTWIYYVFAAGVVVFHLVDRTSVLVRWLLLVPTVVGLLRARQCFKNVEWCDRYFHLTPDHTTRNELKVFGGILRMSAAVFAISVAGLLAVLFLV